MWLFLLTVLFIVLVYKLAIAPWFYWKNRGVPHHSPWPLLGNFYAVMARKRSFFDFQEDIYKQFPNERYSGIFQLTSSSLYIRDLELIKQIGVKEFDHFVDHRMFAPVHDVLLYKTLISLKGSEWREMRAFLSPTFTSSKMRGMFELMAACTHRVVDYYLEMESSEVELELKDLFTRYTNDVIATCAFGVECDSLKNPENEFFLAGKDATNFGGIRGIKMMFANFAPELFRFFRMRVFPKSFSDFFIDVITKTVEHREKHNVLRPDVIHLLLEARKGKLKHDSKPDENDQGFAVVEESHLEKTNVRLEGISDIDIAAQCFIFYIAGFDTVSTILSFALTELAIQSDIQQKLFLEINEAMDRTNGKLTYEAVMKMKYLDMIVSETLRKWTPAPALDRLCTKDYTIEPSKSSEVALTIKAGETIFIPVIGIHKDPKYFPNPERFDPERFSEENREKLIPYSYIPFGIGPRACIASRFALLETKILMAEFLHKFEVTVVKKTSVPIRLGTKSIRLAPEGGFWVGLKKRNRN